ncbi:MAG TPA: hypothetical protein VNI81_15400 [Candidatus Limnocylindrales bacterium]|nr:hypothetical protein [Candidatus Limnocylindrales bacterium]
MKRSCFVLVFLATLALAASQPARAQMGMDIFKRPAITKVFHPVVGKGAVYLDTTKDGKSRNSEISIVGQESFEGKEGFWMQFVAADADGKSMVGKSLITPDDFQFHRMIVQMAGQPAMEMPMKMNASRKERLEEKFEDWHSVGTESVTVPAGTFSCEHWRNDKSNSDVWTSEKISPFGLVKEVRPNSTMVLTKILDNAPDRITGPVKQFDMQQMMQEMQQQRQQKQQP